MTGRFRFRMAANNDKKRYGQTGEAMCVDHGLVSSASEIQNGAQLLTNRPAC